MSAGSALGIRTAALTAPSFDIRSRRRAALRQAGSFAVIGVFSTLAYVALYAVLRGFTPAPVANALALVVTAVGNTAANRRLTFQVRGPEGLARDHATGLLALGAALAITSASLGLLAVLAPDAGRAVELGVLVTANAAATLVRFLLLRLALGARRTCQSTDEPMPAPSRLERTPR
jgi:putative flippase GtrA